MIIGYIGDVAKANNLIDVAIKSDDQLVILEAGANIAEIREFRNKLCKRTLLRKVGIIHLINKLPEPHVAVLLKILEEMLDNDICYYTASYLPIPTIVTRSVIYYLNSDVSKYKPLMDFMVYKMQNNQYTDEVKDGFNIYANYVSLFNDGVIDLNTFRLVCRSIGIDADLK